MNNYSEIEISNCSVQPFGNVRRFSLETESETESEYDIPIMSNVEEFLWLERDVWIPNFDGEIEYEIEMQTQYEYERLIISLIENGVAFINDAEDNDYMSTPCPSETPGEDFRCLSPENLRSSEDEEQQIDYRSENLRMYEDSDYEFDEDPILNDVFLPQAIAVDDDNDEVGLLANGEFEWILENLDNHDHERIIGEEILLSDPN